MTAVRKRYHKTTEDKTMTKEQAATVKKTIDEITGKKFTKTFSAKSAKLHIRISTYIDSEREPQAEWIEKCLNYRNELIRTLRTIFPEYQVEPNSKRYQGFINDICITME